MDALVRQPSVDDASKEANLTNLVVEFMKKASKGLPCVCFNENTRERVRTLYILCTTTENLNYLVILSPKQEEGALAKCRLALISHIFSVEHDGEQAFPQGLLEHMTIEERDQLAVVAYRKEVGDKQPLRLCLLHESREARNEFLDSLRILNVYCKTRLNVNPKNDTLLGACLPCTGGKPRQGRKLVDGIHTAFQIYTPQKSWFSVEDQEEIDINQERADTDGKIHIVWRLTKSQIRNHGGKSLALLGNDTKDRDKENIPLLELEEPPNEAADVLTMCMGTPIPSTLTDLDEYCSWRDELHLEHDLQHAKLFAADGSRMEYYSVTHKRWFPAIVRVEFPHDTFGAPTYNALLSKDQEKRNVMSLLRRPLGINDLVEVFLNPNLNKKMNMNKKLHPNRLVSPNVSGQSAEGRAWIAGRIPYTPDKAASRMGYAVRLDHSGETLERVPSCLIRLRFPRGARVYVFKGCFEGWVSGVVGDSASVNGVGATCYKLNVLEHQVETAETNDHRSRGFERKKTAQEKRLETMRRQMSGKQLDRQTSKMLELGAIDNPFGKQAEIDPWVLVPVLLDGADDVEEFPSYLVRHGEMSTVCAI